MPSWADGEDGRMAEYRGEGGTKMAKQPKRPQAGASLPVVVEEESGESNAIEFPRGQAIKRADPDELTVDQVLAQAEKVRDVMLRGMTEGLHYGKIPGVSKPTL